MRSGFSLLLPAWRSVLSILARCDTEEIDSERDQRSAIMLSETANAISATVKAQQKAIERIVYGPKDEPLSEFYTKLGAETNPVNTNVSAPTPTLSRDQDI